MVALSMRQRRAALWTLLAAGFLLVNFHRTATGVLADTLASTFDATAAELGLLHASFFYIYAGLQLPSGLIVDRYGPRRVGTAGLVVMTVGVLWFSTSGSLLTGFLSRAVVGLGGSVLYIATLRFCASWFRADQYATMTGYTIAAAGVGGILATTPLALAIESAGWQTAMVAAGAASGILGLGVAAFVRDTPARADHDPVGETDEGTASLADVIANTKTVLGERETWLMGVMLFFTLGTNFTVLGLWGVPFIADTYSVSVATASLYVLAGNVGFVLGSPVFGSLSDRLERRTELVFGASVLFALVWVLLLFVPPLPVVGLVLFLALFANGGVALVFTVGKERHEPEVAGTVTGVINSIGYFGAAVMPTVMGGALDAFWTGEVINGARVYTTTGYQVAFGIAVLAGLIAAACAFWLHRREQRAAVGPQATAADD
jgi:sugar phosphate permease